LESMTRSTRCWCAAKVPTAAGAVDQSRLAVVDVGDDREIADRRDIQRVCAEGRALY